MTMRNEEIALQIEEDAILYGSSRRSGPIFEIRRIMAEKGIRNSDVAARLKVSEANVSRMLRGDQNVKIDTLYMLADAVQETMTISFSESYSAVLCCGVDVVTDVDVVRDVYEGYDGYGNYPRLDFSGMSCSWSEVAIQEEVLNESAFALSR
ncbi:helix-turn-helix domain-containing protein [Pseudomonas farris]